MKWTKAVIRGARVLMNISKNTQKSPKSVQVRERGLLLK